MSKPKETQTGSEQITKSSPSNGVSLDVDGKWGNSTTLALQKALGTPQDGFISKQPRNSVSQSLYGNTVQFGSGGSNVIVALQKKVGASADGKLGPGTAQALQKYLGTPQDGVLSRPSMVVEEMQRRLNVGRF
ncbi:hypothetical protein [Oceanobacillus sojae]|uniref:hypothetical protein n=1 Tax=Oceanobacillus sojae TaxID=582851 RepID=UPI003628B150